MYDEITDNMFTSGTLDLNPNIKYSESWVVKYCPKTFDDCLLKSEEKKQMNEWLEYVNKPKEELPESSKNTKGKKAPKKTKKNKCKYDTNCLFLHGPPGIGKTTIANLLFKKFKYDVIEFNSSDTRTAKTIQERLDQVGGSHNVIDFMCNKKTKIAIILDEIDGLSSGDKGGMSEINNIIQASRDKNTPFICISNNICKKTDSLKRKSYYMKIAKPSDIIIKKIITKISEKESLKLDDLIQKKIVEKSQGDIRRCVTLLEYIFRNKNKLDDKKEMPSNNIKLVITEKNSNQHELNVDYELIETDELSVTQSDDEDQDDDETSKLFSEIDNYSRKLTELLPYEMCEKVLNSTNTLEFFMKNFNFDHSMTNWYIYENFIKYIEKNRIASHDVKVRNIKEFFANFTMGDIFEYQVVQSQNYEFYDYINIIKTHGASFWANHELKKTTYNKMGMMNYSTLLNKTSLEYSNSKNWSNINACLNCNQDTQITTELCDIIYRKIENKDFNFIRNLNKLNDLNLNYSDLERIIKMSSFYNKNNTNILSTLKKNEIIL
jgi:DNA polymerase III delta prime subunit